MVVNDNVLVLISFSINSVLTRIKDLQAGLWRRESQRIQCSLLRFHRSVFALLVFVEALEWLLYFLRVLDLFWGDRPRYILGLRMCDRFHLEILWYL